MKELFHYDPTTGELIWKPRPRSHFSTEACWKTVNTRQAGRIAGNKPLGRNGDRTGGTVRVNYKSTLLHRIIWEMHHGAIPDGMVIDHINGDPWDNRLDNLRLATNAENLRNRGKQRNNTSGYKGVSWHKAASKWGAFIKTNGVRKHLGLFSDINDAVKARQAASNQYHKEFSHG